MHCFEVIEIYKNKTFTKYIAHTFALSTREFRYPYEFSYESKGLKTIKNYILFLLLKKGCSLVYFIDKSTYTK